MTDHKLEIVAAVELLEKEHKKLPLESQAFATSLLTHILKHVKDLKEV